MRENKRIDDEGSFAPLLAAGIGLAVGVMVGYALCAYSARPDALPAPELPLAQLNRIERMQRYALGALGTVQANQKMIWTNGIVELKTGNAMLLRAQVKAGRLKVKHDMPDSSVVERGAVNADVAGSSPAPAAKELE